MTTPAPSVPPSSAAPPSESRGARIEAWSLLVAALSLGAALLHAGAVSAHAEHTTLAWLFATAAAAQGAFAVLVVARPSRPVLWFGVAVNASVLGAYVASRLVGLPIEGLEAAEPVAFGDLVCAALEVGVIAGVLAMLAPWRAAGRHRMIGVVPAVAVVAAVTLLAAPALATGHAHEEGHDHAASGSHAADHDHGDATGEHAHDDAHDDAKVSAASRARADDLIAETKQELAKWSSVDAAVADGFVSIGDGRTGFEHFVSAEFARSPETLDAAHPESLVYAVDADGTKTLVSAMYITPPGTSMDDVPDVGGAPWHVHDNLCWDETGQRLAGIVIDGKCVPGGTLRVTAPMLHVWVVPNECGPFAGLENSANLRGSASAGGGRLVERALDTMGDADQAETDAPCSHHHGS